MASTKLKASDRQTLLTKIIAILKRKYGGSVPADERNVLESMLFACCLENARYEDAEAAYETMMASFHDMNEIRVSSISELERTLSGLDDAAWRAFRVRDILQHVFEEFYIFDFETLRRKTMDAAEKQLAKIRGLSDFIRLYTLQHALGAHVIPVDDLLCRVLAWLGMIEPDTPPLQASEELKSSVRKSDVPLLCCLLRELGTDPEFKSSFRITKSMLTDGAVDATDSPERLQELLSGAGKGGKTRTRKKPAGRRPASRTGRNSRSASKKAVTKKVTRPKRAVKKKTTRRSAGK